MPEETEKFIALDFTHQDMEWIERKSADLYDLYRKRRSVRVFSDEPVSRSAIETLIRIAGTAPSGANKQPWTFCAVADPELKRRIREAAEQEEYENYHGRMSGAWMHDLKDLGTDWHKEFLETAPWLIVIFRKSYDLENGVRTKNYYVQESVGIAAGMLIAAIHEAGLVTLTHTPSPMDFLTALLGRPENEKAFLLMPVGYPASGCRVPDIRKKELDEFAVFHV